MKKSIKNQLSKILLLIFFLFFYQCADKDPVTGEKILRETSPIERSKQYVKDGGGITVFGQDKKKDASTYDFATSNPLWRATLKSLAFMPLLNVDYSGGVILYDWYSDNINSNEQIKITIRFLSNEIRSDSLEVIVHKKNCNENNSKCSTTILSNEIPSEIKDKIISSARTIKIEEEKKKKNN